MRLASTKSIVVLFLLAACAAPAIESGLETDGENLPDRTNEIRDGGAAATKDTGSTQATESFTLTVTMAGSGTGTITSTPAGVTCTGTTCKGSFPRGTTVTLQAAPAAGAVFGGWSGQCTGADACAPVVDKDVAVSADFTSLDGAWTGTYTNTRRASGCTFNNAGNLSVTATVAGGKLQHTANVTGLEIRAIPSCDLVAMRTGAAPISDVTVTGSTLTGTWSFAVQNPNGTLTMPFTGKVTGKTLAGTWTCPVEDMCTGSFTVTKP